MSSPPGISGKCLFQIFTDPDVGFEAITTDGERFGLTKRGVDSPIIIHPDTWYRLEVMSDWIELSEIGWETFDRLREKYCPEE